MKTDIAPTRRGDQIDTLHGVAVPDPYRWLEDPTSDETRAWVEGQNAATFAFLGQIGERAAISARLLELWDYERLGVPWTRSARTFYFKNDGLQNQAVLWTIDPEGGAPRILLDPNPLAADGTVALAGVATSRDGRWLAYGLSSAGSDWQEWRVRDIANGEDLPDRLEWVRFSGASFSLQGDGFFYSRYDAPPAGAAHTALARDQRLCWHQLGTPQSDDVVVYARPDQPEWGFGGGVSDDGDYLVISVWHGTDPKTRLFVRQGDGPVEPLFPDGDAAYGCVGNDGDTFYIVTDADAPRSRLVAVSLADPRKSAWREIIPEAADALESVTLVGGRFIATYLHDAHTVVRVFEKDGSAVGDVALPGLGTASGFGGLPDDEETFYSFQTMTMPPRIYRYDVARNVSTLYAAPTVKFDPEAYATRQVFAASKDGTRVPIFVTSRVGPTAGPAPTILYGYGGFNISLTPTFDVGRVVWLELGGVHATATLRGGAEYGEAWHQAGCGKNRQNVFDDFIAAAEHLVADGTTKSDRLAIMGGSNGGLLVGACVNQRPELFAAALPDVGVMDMLRFHKFTIGWAWISDYGNPDDAEDFAAILKYSPLHNLKAGAHHPATLITTADTDDRVVSAHSFKYAAALQAAQGGPAPVLIRVETRAGHGAGKPTAKVIEVTADRLAFLRRVLAF